MKEKREKQLEGKEKERRSRIIEIETEGGEIRNRKK